VNVRNLARRFVKMASRRKKFRFESGFVVPPLRLYNAAVESLIAVCFHSRSKPDE
jgi:hypothetical protein